MSIDWNVPVGTIVTNGVLGGIGYVALRLLTLGKRLVHQHDEMYHDVDKHAGVINTHTTLLVRAGVADGVNIPRLERRRQKRVADPELEGDLS